MFWTPSGAFCEAITWCRTAWDLRPAAPSCLSPLSIYFFYSTFTHIHSTTRNRTPTLQEFIWTALFVIGPPGPLLPSQYHFTVIASPQALMWEEEEQQREKQRWRIRLISEHRSQTRSCTKPAFQYYIGAAFKRWQWRKKKTQSCTKCLCEKK